MTADSFGHLGMNLRFVASVVLFGVVFALTIKRKVSPVVLILASGAVGILLYTLFPQA